MSQDVYISKALAVHNNFYDYSKVSYKNMQTKIVIICPIHGEFMQLPQPHLKGQGCPKCGIIKKKQSLIDKYGFDNPMKIDDFKKKAQVTCLSRYGSTSPLGSDEIRNKGKITSLEKYGVEHHILADEVVAKRYETTMKHYGVKNVFERADFQEKIRQTNKKKYGHEYVLSSDKIREKINQTNILRYGGVAPMCSESVREKAEITCNKKYGFNHPSQSKEIMDKINFSKKNNGSHGSSDSEEIMLQKLISIFGEFDVEYQYFSEKYPFLCDFYIKSLDLYIELNATWTHGHHWFDINNQSDIDLIKVWKSKHTKYYDNAVDNWSNRDLLKMNYAKKNKLNYLVFWDCDLKDFDLWVACDCPNGHDYEKMYSWIDDVSFDGFDFEPRLTGSSKNFSYLAKCYHFSEFYNKEINIWSDNNVYKNMSLQMWLYCNRFRYLGKLPHELTPLEILRSFTISGIHKGYSRFDTTLMCDVLKKYDIHSVLDPFAGWGERLLCCFYNNVDYFGIDINKNLENGYCHMINDFNIVNQKVSFDDSLSFDLPDCEYDAVITCPPYFNLEDYSHNYIMDMAYDDFLIWWSDIVNKFSNVKYFCFQINQKYKSDMSDIVEKYNFRLIEVLNLNSNNVSHFNRKNGNINKKEYESMLVFERIK